MYSAVCVRVSLYGIRVLDGVCVFFFKQNTAYEMRISDWSSDVCSSDLRRPLPHRQDAETGAQAGRLRHHRPGRPHPAARARPCGDAAVLRAQARRRRLTGGRSHFIRLQKKARSEEHTSELQSLMRISYAVFCLINKKQYIPPPT